MDENKDNQNLSPQSEVENETTESQAQQAGEQCENAERCDERGPRRSADAALDRNDLFQALESPRRRYVLYSFFERCEWRLPTLARRVAAIEDGTSVAHVSHARMEDVLLSLYHVHLPVLVERDLLEFDDVVGTVSTTSRTGTVLRVLAEIGRAMSVEPVEPGEWGNTTRDG
jgi:hypothetical protein